MQTAKVVCAWEAAVGRTTAQRNLEAEQRTAGGMYVTVRKTLGSTLGSWRNPLSPSSRPSRSLWRVAQVDDGKFVAESLSEAALNEDTTVRQERDAADH